MPENLTHPSRLLALKQRIFIQPCQRFLARLDKQARIADEIGQAKIGEARLARAQQFSGDAQFEIRFGDLEAVGFLLHYSEPLGGNCTAVAMID